MFSTSRFQVTVTCKGLFVLIHMFLLVTHSQKNFRVKVIVISPSKLNYISSSFNLLMMTGKTKCQSDTFYCILLILHSRSTFDQFMHSLQTHHYGIAGGRIILRRLYLIKLPRKDMQSRPLVSDIMDSWDWIAGYDCWFIHLCCH